MVELAPRLGKEALLGIDHNVIDLAVLIRVLRQPEGMPVLAIPQGPVLGIATRYHRRRLRPQTTGGFVRCPTELSESGQSHELADLHSILDARPRMSREHEPRNSNRARSSVAGTFRLAK